MTLRKQTYIKLYAKSLIFQSKQPAYFQHFTKNKIHTAITCLVKMIRRPKQLQLT